MFTQKPSLIALGMSVDYIKVLLSNTSVQFTCAYFKLMDCYFLKQNLSKF